MLGKTLVALSAVAITLGVARGEQIAINFIDGPDWAPLTDPAGAFGIPLANWNNSPEGAASGGLKGADWTWNLPLGGDLDVAWTCVNTWSLAADVPTAGDDQVIYGYLDDTGVGYTLTLTGLRAIASSFTITTIASTDNGDAFQDVEVFSSTETNTLQYLANSTPSFAGGLFGMSTVSPSFVTLNGNDSVTIRGANRSGSSRSCVAGIIIDYVPSTVGNAPLIEVEPEAPAGPLFPGDSFQLKTMASGSPTLAYQWRRDGLAIPGANSADYTVESAAVEDSGEYDVVVTNPSGSTTSETVLVTIQDVSAPVIVTGPLSQSLYQGYPATFGVEATGGQLSYQWKLDGADISGATDAIFTVETITTDDAGEYTVEVSNPVGPTASASATLDVKVPPAGSYEEVVASTKPLLWYRYNEMGPKPENPAAANSGSLGAAGDGAYEGSVTHPVPGALVGSADMAAEFVGGTVSVPYNDALNPAGAFSVDCWIKPNGSGNGMIVQEMINGENPGNTDDRTGWGLRLNGTSLRFYVGQQWGAPYYYYYTTAGDVVTPGEWQHVAMVYDGTAPSLYINGALVATTVTRQDGLDITQPEIDAIRIIPNYAAPMIVGNRGYGGWTFQGSIDEVALYPSALTPAQVLAHHQNGIDPTPAQTYDALVTGDGAVEYLRLNDPAPASPIKNSGTLGSAWDGTYNGDIAPGAAGPRPEAAPGFESDNVAVVMTNGYAAAPMLPLNTNTVTVTCWLKPETTPSSSDLGWPAWLGDGGMHIENTSGRPQRELRYHWKGGQWGWGSGLVVPENTWTFVAMVVEPDKATFYMSDGGTLRSAVHNATHAALDITSPAGFGGNQPGRADRNYIGEIDESTVYNRALSQSEITSLFLVGTGAPFNVELVPGGIIEDTSTAGATHNGSNLGTTWTASSSDSLGTTREGVQVFSTENATQIVTDGHEDFNPTQGTIMFWMRSAGVDVPGPGNEAAMLVDRRTDVGTVITLNDAGAIFVQCRPSGANNLEAGFVVDQNWHHVAVTFDQAFDETYSQGVQIYIDGVGYGLNPNSAAWAWPTDQQLELGRSHDGYWKRFDGEMDEFRFYNRILTDAEIADVYNSDAIVDGSALVLHYPFNDEGIGHTVKWPFGTLLSSPKLGPDATWTPVPGATPPSYPLILTGDEQYFRATP